MNSIAADFLRDALPYLVCIVVIICLTIVRCSER